MQNVNMNDEYKRIGFLIENIDSDFIEIINYKEWLNLVFKKIGIANNLLIDYNISESLWKLILKYLSIPIPDICSHDEYIPTNSVYCTSNNIFNHYFINSDVIKIFYSDPENPFPMVKCIIFSICKKCLASNYEFDGDIYDNSLPILLSKEFMNLCNWLGIGDFKQVKILEYGKIFACVTGDKN